MTNRCTAVPAQIDLETKAKAENVFRRLRIAPTEAIRIFTLRLR
jgi:antitoxin component of RelBE/YafQ-DinJ toxin-antitoxin module